MNIEKFVEFMYKGQKRKNGDKATSHLYAVKKILEEEGIKEKTILDAALLHDILEDTTLSKEYLEFKFGEKISKLVQILSKDKSWTTQYCKMKSNIDEMETTWQEHPEAVLIKMADRLHNLRTIDGFSIEKQKEYLEETKEILIPLFTKVLEKNHLGYLSAYIKDILSKLHQEITHLEHKLSIT